MPNPIRFERADDILGLACLIVLITHAISMFFANSAKYLAGTGKIGVWLFFVLSAFLLTYKFEATGFGISAILRYSLGRFLRIIPLFALAIIAYHFFGAAGIDTWGDAFDCLFFNRGFAHLWTIPVEFKFYFCLPILALTFKYIQKRWGLRNSLFVIFYSYAFTNVFGLIR